MQPRRRPFFFERHEGSAGPPKGRREIFSGRVERAAAIEAVQDGGGGEIEKSPAVLVEKAPGGFFKTAVF